MLRMLKVSSQAEWLWHLGLDMPLVSAGVGSLLNLGYWIALRASINVSSCSGSGAGFELLSSEMCLPLCW